MSMITATMERFEEENDLTLPLPENPSSPLLKPKLKRLKKASSPPIRTDSSDLDPLFAYRTGEEMLDDSCVPANDEEEVEVVAEESEKERNVKRRLCLDEDLNVRRKKQRKCPDGKPKESVMERKRLEKARKAELEQLHAESQRLLRETRNASFKPMQLIQKPISSVLEKIRLRKLEILKSCKVVSSVPSVVDADCIAESDCKSDLVNGQSDIKEADRNANVVLDVDSKETHKNLTNDAEADKSDPQLSPGVDNLLNSQEVSPPSYPPASSLKIDGGGNDDGDASSSDSDVSSSEEESDKENISPTVCNNVNKDSSLKDDLAKAFLDDEAEEEDDSDCDLLRFQENEEENESDEHEELDDLIATGYEELPMDQEKRNELHQKWLQQQDAAETDNVLQRLKSGRQGHGKSPFIHGDYDNHDESSNDDDEVNDGDDDGDDGALYKSHSKDSSRQKLKRAKQMISSMFTDANDVYIPSDDEEAEKNLMRHHILKQIEEQSMISPVEDENSREFFGLIKKLNIAPSSKKRGKASAPLFDSLVLSGNSNSSSKSSFLNRTSNSLPSAHKQGGSISVRTYIFGRDESNSRSNISTSEINSETVEKESISAKNTMKDKHKSSIIKRTIQANSKTTDSSLFNILRQSSIQFDKKLEVKHSVTSSVIAESQAAHKFSAFKLRRNSKMDART